MKSNIRTLTLSALVGLSACATADTTVYVDANKTWNGFMEVSALPADGGGFIFQSAWGFADLNASFSGSSLILSPNTIGDPNEFWYQNTSGTATPPNVGGPGQLGNKSMTANAYVEVNDGSLSGQNVTFEGNVSSFTFTSAHTTSVFIKDFAPDYSSSNQIVVPITAAGPFSVNLATDPGAGRHVQYGFVTTGENVWVTDTAPFGTVVIDAISIPPGNPNVTVDPAAPWQGYMNVFFSSGDYEFGDTWGTRDLVAVFSESGPATLTLRPNSIDPVPDGINNEDWYFDLVGNSDPADYVGEKIMEANFYVQGPDGSLAGQTLNFSGNVASNSLTGHDAIVFIKDFAPDYSSFVETTAPLNSGAFSISQAIGNDPSRHVQYGFQVKGENVWITNVAPFGEVVIDADLTNSYETFITRYFPGVTDPMIIGKTADPDGDKVDNNTEFALNRNPNLAGPLDRLRSAIEDVSGNQAMLITLPVLNGANFSGASSQSATTGPLNYTIEGSNDLTLFDQAVSEVSPARAEGMPLLDAGWNYRTFRLDGTVGSGGRGPKGFLRSEITEFPVPD